MDFNISTMIVSGRVSREEYDNALGEMEERGAVTEHCQKCNALLDVSECTPLTETTCPSCGAMIKVLAGFYHFILLSKLGQGGSGTVYRAFDQTLERDVALKLLRNEHTRDTRYIEELEREAFITASINHPHVIKVYSTGCKNGFYYIAMEIVNGGSVADRIRRDKRQSEATVLSIGKQLAEGLQAAWERGLLHRDVKPANVLFSDRDTIKVSDFGLALPVEQATDDSGDIWGTPDYIAPEKLLRHGEDIRSDIYSFGCTLFHCLAGAPPLDTTTVMLVIRTQTAQTAPNIQDVVPEVSGATAFVIERCLEKDPAKRYQSYHELIEHLCYAEEQLGGKSSSEQKDRETHVGKPSGASHRRFMILKIAALVASLAIPTVFFAHRQMRAMHARHPIAPLLKAENAPKGDASFGSPMKDKEFADAVVAIGTGGATAGQLIDALVARPNPEKTMLCWAETMQGIQRLADHRTKEAVQAFQKLAISAKWLESTELRASFTSLSETGASGSPIPVGPGPDFPQRDLRQLSFLVIGLKAWESGDGEKALLLLKEYGSPQPGLPPEPALLALMPLAESRIQQDLAINDLEAKLGKSRTLWDGYQLERDLRTAAEGPLRFHAEAALSRVQNDRVAARKNLADISSVQAYRIVNRATGLCLTEPENTDGDGPGTGTPKLMPFHPGSLGQCWRFPRLTYGQYSIVSASDGRALSKTTRPGSESPVILSQYKESDWVQCYVAKAGDGSYLTFACENGGGLIGIKDGTAGESAEIVLAPSHSSLDQQWQLQSVAVEQKWAKKDGKLQVEWMPLEQKSADSYRALADYFGGHCSTVFDAFGPEAFVTLRISGVAAGSYKVFLGFLENDMRGQFKVEIGPVKGKLEDLGGKQDGYSANRRVEELALGSWMNLKTQDCWIKFTVTGKNPDSKGYMLGLDFVRLVPQ